VRTRVRFCQVGGWGGWPSLRGSWALWCSPSTSGDPGVSTFFFYTLHNLTFCCPPRLDQGINTVLQRCSLRHRSMMAVAKRMRMTKNTKKMGLLWWRPIRRSIHCTWLTVQLRMHIAAGSRSRAPALPSDGTGAILRLTAILSSIGNFQMVALFRRRSRINLIQVDHHARNGVCFVANQLISCMGRSAR
jgi:hypothetical protein